MLETCTKQVHFLIFFLCSEDWISSWEWQSKMHMVFNICINNWNDGIESTYSRDKSLLRKRKQSRLEDWVNKKSMSFSKSKSKALHMGWNKPKQCPRLGSCLLRCGFGSAGEQKAEHKSAAVSQQGWGQTLPWAGRVKVCSEDQRCHDFTLPHPEFWVSVELPQFERHWQPAEGGPWRATKPQSWLENWRHEERLMERVCSAKRKEGLEALIKLVIKGSDALFTRINSDRTRGNRHLQEEIHTGIRKKFLIMRRSQHCYTLHRKVGESLQFRLHPIENLYLVPIPTPVKTPNGFKK